MIAEKIKKLLGDRVGERECFGERREYYVEAPVKGDLEALLALMTENGYKPMSDTTRAKNRYLLYRTDEGALYISYTYKLGCIRIFLDKGKEPYLGSGARSAKGEAHLTLMNMAYDDEVQVSHDNGLGMIVTLADGSFIIYDGGYCTEVEGLLRFLTDNAPKNTKPVIRAWVLTHTHMDHYGCFDTFVRRYSDRVDIQTIIACIVLDEFYGGKRVNDRYFNDVLPLLAKEKNLPIVTPTAGQIYEYAGVKMEVIQTAEDLYPLPVGMENHASTVTRLIFDEQRRNVLVTADVARSAVSFLVSTWGDYLKSDIMQVPHHGHSGATKELFDTVDPEVVIYTTDRKHYLERIESNTAWNHYLINELNVKKAFVADGEYQIIL
ncbi:MAG: MBL fold metallo-hydrolase [Clostridia bacterium]|nr:MBL fold metallo-hydrolase [Clostridia bacterium]